MLDIFKDEQGAWSSARCALWVALALFCYLTIRGLERPQVVWDSLQAIVLALVGWAGGARVMQYVSALRAPKPELLPDDSTGISPGSR